MGLLLAALVGLLACGCNWLLPLGEPLASSDGRPDSAPADGPRPDGQRPDGPRTDGAAPLPQAAYALTGAGTIRVIALVPLKPPATNVGSDVLLLGSYSDTLQLGGEPLPYSSGTSLFIARLGPESQLQWVKTVAPSSGGSAVIGYALALADGSVVATMSVPGPVLFGPGNDKELPAPAGSISGYVLQLDLATGELLEALPLAPGAGGQVHPRALTAAGNTLCLGGDYTDGISLPDGGAFGGVGGVFSLRLASAALHIDEAAPYPRQDQSDLVRGSAAAAHPGGGCCVGGEFTGRLLLPPDEPLVNVTGQPNLFVVCDAANPVATSVDLGGADELTALATGPSELYAAGTTSTGSAAGVLYLARIPLVPDTSLDVQYYSGSNGSQAAGLVRTPAGPLLLAATLGTSLALDGHAFPVAADHAALLAQFNPKGAPTWGMTLTAAAVDSTARGVALDSAGNRYLWGDYTGASRLEHADPDISLPDPSGTDGFWLRLPPP